MQKNRREFLVQASTAVALAAVPISAAALQSGRNKWRAITFDALVIFDPAPVFALSESLFPDQGRKMNELWKTRQFEYTWLRTLSGQYTDFFSITRDALVFAAKSLKVDVKPGQMEQLLQGYLHLKVWPEVPLALQQLKKAGLQLGLLSNFSEEMLAANLKNSGLDGCFEQVLSTDRVKAFKPDSRAYQMGIDAFKLKRAEIVFAAFGGWDAAGAKSFGYTTFWVNWLHAMEEEIGAHADATGGMDGLINFLSA